MWKASSCAVTWLCCWRRIILWWPLGLFNFQTFVRLVRLPPVSLHSKCFWRCLAAASEAVFLLPVWRNLFKQGKGSSESPLIRTFFDLKAKHGKIYIISFPKHSLFPFSNHLLLLSLYYRKILWMLPSQWKRLQGAGRSPDQRFILFKSHFCFLNLFSEKQTSRIIRSKSILFWNSACPSLARSLWYRVSLSFFLSFFWMKLILQAFHFKLQPFNTSLSCT